MPIHGEVFKGKVTCKDCNNEFTWIYQYWEKYNTSVVKIPKKGENEEILKYDGSTLSSCHCPKCGYPNEYVLVPY